MLPKPNRLTKKKDFDAVFKRGKSVKSGFLVCKILENNLPGGGTASRFGFVVSKKISSKAVVRNKTKRRMQNAVALYLGEVKKPMDAVIVALPGIEKKEFLEIREMICGAFKKLNIT